MMGMELAMITASIPLIPGSLELAGFPESLLPAAALGRAECWQVTYAWRGSDHHGASWGHHWSIPASRLLWVRCVIMVGVLEHTGTGIEPALDNKVPYIYGKYSAMRSLPGLVAPGIAMAVRSPRRCVCARRRAARLVGELRSITFIQSGN